MDSTLFSGTFTAMVTPLAGGEVAYGDLRSLVEAQVAAGVEGLVAVGTTGESPTLSHAEHLEVVRATVETTAGRLPVIAGSGSNSTREAIALTRGSTEAGADALLVVAPYYNKPSQEGLFEHFSALAEETDKPVILYSIPSRCGVEIGVETVARLAEKYPHVRTIKEAGGSCERVSLLLQEMGDAITVLSGDDSLTLPFMALGATGVISVASNVAGPAVAGMVRAALANDFATAGATARLYFRLFSDLFIESNPAPVKYALQRVGVIADAEVRRPLCPVSPASARRLDETLEYYGLLEGQVKGPGEEGE